MLKGMIEGMVKNYIIGFLSGYVLVQLPFWTFDNILQPVFIVAVFGFWLAWFVRYVELGEREYREMEEKYREVKKHYEDQ